MIFKIIFTTQPKSHVEDARVHCVVLKVRAVPTPHATTVTAGKAHEEQPPTTPAFRLAQPAPGPSGPNSVHVPTPPTRTVPTASCVLDPNHRHEHPIKCSTHELPATHIRC